MLGIMLCDSDDFDTVLPFCLSEGLGIELQSFWDPNRAGLFPALVEYQLKKIEGITSRVFHGTFGDLNCGSYDPMIREVSRKRMTLSYQTACQLRARRIVFHHGYVPHTSPPEKWVSRFVQFWRSFLEDKPLDVHFQLENQLELSPDLLCETLDTISDARLSACLDVGHAHCNSNTPVLGWIERLGKRIEHVHLHDNDGTDDQHLAIGAGSIPFKEVCAALNEYAPEALWSLEARPHALRKSYDWLRQNGLVTGI